MVTISRVTVQERNKNRYNIYIHNGEKEMYGFSVDEDLLVQYNLRKGLTLSDEKVARLKDEDTIHQSYHKVINYLSYRMRTEKEIRDYLIRHEVDDEHIEQVISQLIDQKFIDDQEFADMFVRSRLNTSTKGPLHVKNELRSKGVSESTAGRAVEKYTYEIQTEKSIAIVEKRLNRDSRQSFRRCLDQAKAALHRNGFTNEVITDVMARFYRSKDENSEWDAIVYQGEKIFRRYQTKHSGDELYQKVKESLYRQGFTVQSIERLIDTFKHENYLRNDN